MIVSSIFFHNGWGRTETVQWTYSSVWSTRVCRSSVYNRHHHRTWPFWQPFISTNTSKPSKRVVPCYFYFCVVAPSEIQRLSRSGGTGGRAAEWVGCFAEGFSPTDKISCRAADHPWRWLSDDKARHHLSDSVLMAQPIRQAYRHAQGANLRFASVVFFTSTTVVYCRIYVSCFTLSSRVCFTPSMLACNSISFGLSRLGY